MVILIILSDMKRSIEILLTKLEKKHVAKHVICPSADALFPELKYLVNDSIEIIDERSAGYVAVGMCEEINAPVVLWCADSDSYRNLTSALTEAYYRKLPILVVALKCEACINQAINPHDTIRYYVNNSTVGSKGTVADIELAIVYLYADVKGPVYLSLGTFSESSIRHQMAICDQIFDASSIARILPSDACIHFGSCISCNYVHIKDVVYRTNHVTKDGNFSMLIGSAVVAPKQLHIGVFSSDEIAYDLNMLGNRHIGNSLIIVCIVQNAQTSAIYDFAHRMQWNCKKISISDIDTMENHFTIGDKPQYIEVAL